MKRPALKAPLALTGDYLSPRYEPSLVARALPSVVFYSRILGIVRRAFLAARKGRFDQNQLKIQAQETIRALERQGVRISVTGVEHFRAVDGPCVFVGNHMSTLETFVLPGLVVPFKPLTFVVKQSLVSMPVFGPIMRSCDPLVVGRSNPREDLRTMLDGGAERLARGLSIAVFPQTTRTTRFEPEAFNSIGTKMAKKAGVPVVPLAIRSDAWSTGRLLRDFGPFRPELPVHFAFGEPIVIEGNGKEAHETTIDFIRSHLAAWYAEVPLLNPA